MQATLSGVQGSSRPSSGLPTEGVCMLMCVVTAPSHLTASVRRQVCVTGREQLQEKEFLMTSVFRIHFFLSAVGLHENVYTNVTHTNSVTHTHGARSDCTRQGIHYCFHESMGKFTPTSTDVAFTTEYG